MNTTRRDIKRQGALLLYLLFQYMHSIVHEAQLLQCHRFSLPMTFITAQSYFHLHSQNQHHQCRPKGLFCSPVQLAQNGNDWLSSTLACTYIPRHSCINMNQIHFDMTSRPRLVWWKYSKHFVYKPQNTMSKVLPLSKY